jgi:hypothetical protein
MIKVKSQIHLRRNEDASVTPPAAWEDVATAWKFRDQARELSDVLTAHARVIILVDKAPVNEVLENLISRSTSDYGFDWDLLRRLNTEAWGADED